MNQQIFVPVTDELIYNRPEEIEGPLVPYFSGMECQHWLSIEINPEESIPVTKSTKSKHTKKAIDKTDNNESTKRQTKLKLAYSC